MKQKCKEAQENQIKIVEWSNLGGNQQIDKKDEPQQPVPKPETQVVYKDENNAVHYGYQ